MGDLEQKVMRKYGKECSIRLTGDISPTQILDPKTPERDTYLKEQRRQSKKKESAIFKKEDMQEELPVEKKLELDRQNIENAVEKEFLKEWVCFYGGASIANLARKHYIHAFSSDRTICLQGSEPIIDHAQRHTYVRIMKQEELSSEDVMAFILETIKREQPRMHEIIVNQLQESGITEDISQFILQELSIENYNGQIPVVSDVFKGYPVLDKFQFEGGLYWEKEDNCVIVHVPYYYFETARDNALEKLPELQEYLNSTEGIPVIAYHANPDPKGMDDNKTQGRDDYNIRVIRKVSEVVLSTIAPKPEDMPLMICGHLHKSNPSYEWELAVNSQLRQIRLFPLGKRDIAFLNTDNGDIDVKQY